MRAQHQSNTFLHGIGFRDYLMFSQIGKTSNIYKDELKQTFPQKACRTKTKNGGKPETP